MLHLHEVKSQRQYRSKPFTGGLASGPRVGARRVCEEARGEDAAGSGRSRFSARDQSRFKKTINSGQLAGIDPRVEAAWREAHERNDKRYRVLQVTVAEWPCVNDVILAWSVLAWSSVYASDAHYARE